MNASYSRMDAPERRRCCRWWPFFSNNSNEELENEDTPTLTQLIKSLHMKKEGAYYKAKEARNEAYNCAQQERRVEAMAHLQVYHARMKIYEQMVGIHQKAVMLRDTVDMSHSVSSTHIVMTAEMDAVKQNRVTPEQIDELLAQLDAISIDTAESSAILADTTNVPDDDPLWEEYDQLKGLTTEQLIESMPTVPTKTLESTKKSSNDGRVKISV